MLVLLMLNKQKHKKQIELNVRIRSGYAIC